MTKFLSAKLTETFFYLLNFFIHWCLELGSPCLIRKADIPDIKETFDVLMKIEDITGCEPMFILFGLSTKEFIIRFNAEKSTSKFITLFMFLILMLIDFSSISSFCIGHQKEHTYQLITFVYITMIFFPFLSPARRFFSA